MGRAGCSRRGAERLACPAPAPRLRPLLQLILGLCCGARLGQCQVPPASPPPQCRIQKCTSDFVTLTSHLTPALDFDAEFCKGLRAYSSCTQRTAKSCRGNLVFHSAVLGISDLMSQRNCSRDGPTSATQPEEPLPEPCDYHSRMLHAHAHAHTHAHMHAHTHGHGHGHHHGHHAAHGAQPPLSVSPPGYLFCGLFGDPHLRTFRDSFQTCKVEGAWPLIDNRFLSVQVTNVPVVAGSSATATNKITIIFKPYESCTEQRVYQAVTDNLPAAFDDGTVSSDPSFFLSSSSSSSSSPGGGAEPAGAASASTSSDGKLRALWIWERVAGRHVELHARYIGVTLVVRQLGRYLTLAARVPEELALAHDPAQDLQLCLNGCPSAERIDRGQGRLPLPPPFMAASPPALGLQAQRGGASPRGFSVEAARARCREQLQDEDIYFHSCVFDLLTTGDANFTAAALSAQKDMESLHPHKERWRIYPRSHATSRLALAPLLCAALALACGVF